MKAISGVSLALVSAVMLASCGVQKVEVPAPLKLGNVSLGQPLRALGTEPFWGVDIGASELVYTSPETENLAFDHEGPRATGDTVVWNGLSADGRKLVVTATSQDCSDGMSDRTYPLTVSVILDATELKGCAASVEALSRVGESGRVE